MWLTCQVLTSHGFPSCNLHFHSDIPDLQRYDGGARPSRFWIFYHNHFLSSWPQLNRSLIWHRFSAPSPTEWWSEKLASAIDCSCLIWSCKDEICAKAGRQKTLAGPFIPTYFGTGYIVPVTKYEEYMDKYVEQCHRTVWQNRWLTVIIDLYFDFCFVLRCG